MCVFFFFFLLPTAVVSTMIISRELHGITSKPGDLGTKISRHSTDCRYSCRMPVHSGVSVSSGGKCRKQQTGFKLLFVSCDVIIAELFDFKAALIQSFVVDWALSTN